jgi:UDP-N-acetylmuramoylalanine--D-glutamate ligase
MAGRIVILGAGESGTGAAMLAQKQGFDVFVSDMGVIKPKYIAELDELDIAWEQGKHTESLILNATEVIKSPGIPEKAPMIKKLREAGIPVIGEIEFAGRYLTGKTIGITGSNGKTTTTLLTHHILKKAGLNVALCGNVGKSLARQVAEGQHDYYVIELSSFQLDDMADFKADIAVLLNITPDHLDRYEYSMDKYAASKFRIVRNQDAECAFIYCLDDLETTNRLEDHPTPAKKYPFSIMQRVEEGAYLENETINININKQQLAMSIHDLALQGKHNAYNSMAAGIAAKVLEIRKEIIRESLSDFQNIEHRLEFVARVHGIDFINDSKATNVNSTWYALESMDKPVVWIAGGVDKGNDYSMLDELVKSKVHTLICMGTDNSKLKTYFNGKIAQIEEAGSAEEAVALAYRFARKDEVVLLSPCCASFDLFENYEDRGTRFKAAVRAL